MDENLAKAQAEDAKQHPNCRYYTNVSKSCRMVNGEGSCEVVQRLWRSCPWRRDRLVHEQRTEEEMESGGMSGMFGRGRGWQEGEQTDDPFAIFDEMRRQQEVPVQGGGEQRASPGELEPRGPGRAPARQPHYDTYIKESKAV